MSVFNALKVAGQALAALKVTEGVINMTESEEPRDETNVDEEAAPKTIVDEIEVETRHLVKRVRELIREGNVRTLRIKDKNGKYLLEIPLTLGVVAGGAFALSAPWAVALSALAGFVVDVKIEIVRDEPPDAPAEPESDED